jgi:hypothetical protein
LVLACLAAARIASTYCVFSQTYDEAAHLAAGMEWLQKGTYTVDNLHPPLGRIAIALGPFLAGIRASGELNKHERGNHILHDRGRYSHNLALARLGILPFFLVTTWMVWAWSRMLFGDAAALLATLLFTTLPPVLAHSGLATTDIPLTATFTGTLLAFTCWLERPTYFYSLLLGLAGGLAILSKFTALLFLPACGLTLLVWRWVATRGISERQNASGHRLLPLGLALFAVFLVIWGGYRFSAATLTTRARVKHRTIDRYLGTNGFLHDLANIMVERVPVPALDLIRGVDELRYKNAVGSRSYLLGEIRQTGWWYFFPLAVGVKTPLPFLILSGVGAVILSRRAWQQKVWGSLAPAVAAGTILLVSLWSRVDLGVRYVLPIYPLLAIVAGFGAHTLWALARRWRMGPAVVVGLLAWQLTSSMAVHPDYLAYFNELSGRHPDRVLVDSDLDWGQDLLRLSDALRARQVDAVALAYFGTADLRRHNLPPFRRLLPYQRTTGWIAISESELKMGGVQEPSDAFSWLEAYQAVAFAGRSIRIYHIAPDEGASVSGGKALPPGKEQAAHPSR